MALPLAGQAIELHWITSHEFDLTDRDHVRMAYKKTCWYTVVAPLRIGVNLWEGKRTASLRRAPPWVRRGSPSGRREQG